MSRESNLPILHLIRSIQKEQVIQRFIGSPEELESENNENTGTGAGNVTWGEAYNACCHRTPKEWGYFGLGWFLALLFLYFFTFGLDLLGTGAKVMGGCTAGDLFGEDINPVSGVMMGMVTTIIMQSSSITTSIVVSLVGAEIASVDQGIYMIMGANIGTSVTNTVVAVGHMGDAEQLERAFAGATVHDMFNFLSVAVLLPIEAISGFLLYTSEYMIEDFKSRSGTEWEGPVKRLVSPLTNQIIIANDGVANDIASQVATCDSFYPNNGTLACLDYNDTLTCKPGLMKCDTDVDEPYCPAFFDPNGTEAEDRLSGLAAFLIGIITIFICLFALIKIIKGMLMGASASLLYKATSINGYLNILIGTGLTMFVQSSSIATSILTPIVGVGALRLDQMLPLTLGANLGATLTAILAALLSKPIAMQVALADLLFNLVGILIWYPIPILRRIPLIGAKRLGQATRIWRGFPLMYVLVTFLAFPVIILGISSLFTTGNRGMAALGGVVAVIVLLILLALIYCCTRVKEILVQQQRQELKEEMEKLRADIRRLAEHTRRQRRAGAVVQELKEEMAKLKAEIRRLAEQIGHTLVALQDEEAGGAEPSESGINDLQIYELRQAFHAFDPDGDGHIDHDELKKHLKAVGYDISEEGIDYVLAQVDDNGDKILDFEEFIAWNRLIWREEMKEKFNAIDAKSRGYIDREQLKAYLTEQMGNAPSDEELDDLCYEMDPEASDKILLDNFIMVMANNGAGNVNFVINGELYLEKLKKQFRDMDVDNSGTINKEELQEIWAEKLGIWLSGDELDEAMKEMDEDGDGEISLAEFIASSVRIRDSTVRKRNSVIRNSMVGIDSTTLPSMMEA